VTSARRLIQGATLAGALLLAPRTFGQSSADVAAARDLFNEAAQLAGEERWEEARDRYERSLALKREPITLYSLGVAQKETGHLVDALESFRAFLRSPRSPSTESYVPVAEAAVTELEAKVAKLELTVRPADAPGLVVEIDGVAIPVAALGRARLVDPGAHDIKARADGHREAMARAELAEGGSESLTLELEPLPAAKAPPPARPEPDAAPSPASDEGGSVVLPVILLVGGAGLIGGGVAVGMAGVSKAADAPASEGDEADSALTLATVGDVMAGVGIAAAGVGLVLLIVTLSDDSASTPDAALANAQRSGWIFGGAGLGRAF
jgi:hypothetical protein